MAERQKRYLYLVEGDTEQKLIDVLKTETKSIRAGKTRVFNLFQHDITKALLTNISPNSVIVLVFDTDLSDPNLTKFWLNVERLNKSKNVKKIMFVPQCINFESELTYSTSIRNITQFFPTETVEQFKTQFIKSKSAFLAVKLKENNFCLEKMWSRHPIGKYSSIKNTAEEIKIND